MNEDLWTMKKRIKELSISYVPLSIVDTIKNKTIEDIDNIKMKYDEKTDAKLAQLMDGISEGIKKEVIEIINKRFGV